MLSEGHLAAMKRIQERKRQARLAKQRLAASGVSADVIASQHAAIDRACESDCEAFRKAMSFNGEQKKLVEKLTAETKS